ncbi:MAG: OmpA family protein [Silicimonas sp.]|nr:OmpA family protein [Silicimonas sp.]
MKGKFFTALAAQCLFLGVAFAQEAPFESGWSLNQEGSSLNFLSVKKGTLMELSSFASLDGTIDENGEATFEIALDSVDTKVDLRNVRMRFLMFETFVYPKATVTAKITPAMIASLPSNGFTTINLPFTLDLHGIKQEMAADVQVSLAGSDQVSISTIAPIVIKVADFNLENGLQKLMEAADVTIVPTTAVTFSVTFNRNKESANQVVASAVANPRATALEPEGYFSEEACKGRFEILSRSGNIYFEKASADLKAESFPLLRDVAFIVSKCPGMTIQVAGYTDSRGKSGYNKWLSEMRSKAVVDSLVGLGLPSNRLISRGFGEANPIASNRTAAGRTKNRRIEFSVLGNFSG